MLVTKKIEKGEQFCVVLVVVRASLSIIEGLSIQSEVLGYYKDNRAQAQCDYESLA
jgi:hypothetical protein